MPSLQEIKTRLSSVATTKKITKAMHLVATSKLRKAKQNLVNIQEYYLSVYETFEKLLNSVQDFQTLLPAATNKPFVHIIITSDLGLCGSYNSNIFKLAKKVIKKEDLLIVLGSKGIAYYKAHNQKIAEEYGQLGDDIEYNFIAHLGNQVISQYLAQEISGVNIIHTKFINSVTFEPQITKILPIEKPKNKYANFVAEFEPDAPTVIKNAIPLYISAIIYGSIIESKVSEMSSRRSAMENATDNADELIEKLDLEYNRVRQASITQEITEIVAGTVE